MIVVRIPIQNQIQIHTLVLTLGWNLLLGLIYLQLNPLFCLRKITCLRIKRIVAPKKTSLMEPDFNLPLKEKHIAKKNNISNTLLSKAKSEKKNRLKIIRSVLLYTRAF